MIQCSNSLLENLAWVANDLKLGIRSDVELVVHRSLPYLPYLPFDPITLHVDWEGYVH
jgi:hypothetical protein